MSFEEIKVELKESWSDRTFVEELVVDQERRIVHIFSHGGSDSLSPYNDIEYDSISFSSAFCLYTEKIFDPEGYYKGLNKHTPDLKKIITELSGLNYSVPQVERETFFLERIRPLQVEVWIQSWSWCFYSEGNTIYIYSNGRFSEIYIPRIFEQPQYLLDLLYSPFKERAIEIQNKYLRGEAGKF